MPGDGFLFGASTADGILDMVLMTDGGTVINATVETSEDNPAPGTFEVSAPLSGTYLDLVDATTASIYETTDDGGGVITLQTCPQSMGDRAQGKFDDIHLVDALTGATRTLTGSFDVVVAGFAEPLHCDEASEPTPTPNNDQPVNNGQTCGWDGGCVTTDGVCCPYAECMSQCQLDCIFEDPDCAGGADPAACIQCGQECYRDVCGVSDACLDAAEDFEMCDTGAGCDQIEDDSEYLSCIQDNCCSEATAAF